MSLLAQGDVALFAVYPTPLSQLLHMHFFAIPYIFFFYQKNVN